MSGIVSSVTDLLTDLTTEVTVLTIDLAATPIADPQHAILQNQIDTNNQGISIANEILGLENTIALDNLFGIDTTALQVQVDLDQQQLAALDLTLCFAHGTHLLTDRGEIRVEDLVIGDMMVTPDGPEATMPIRWIGRQHYEGDAARFTQPVLVREGALGNGLPHRDLRLSGDHCLYLEGRLVPAKLLVNGFSIVLQRGHAVLDYANIELDRHCVVLAEGVTSETYLDCGNRFRFDNATEANDWLSTRTARTDQAWADGTAFAPPLWDGPELAALRERLAAKFEQKQAA